MNNREDMIRQYRERAEETGEDYSDLIAQIEAADDSEFEPRERPDFSDGMAFYEVEMDEQGHFTSMREVDLDAPYEPDEIDFDEDE